MARPTIVGDRRVEFDMSQVSIANLTIPKMREAIMTNMLLSGPGLYEEYMPSPQQLERINLCAQLAIKSGQVIDFGYWPNEMIKDTSLRSGKLYNDGALGMPFSSPWIFVHSWDSPDSMEYRKSDKPVTVAYLVDPENDELGCGFQALEMDAFNIAGLFTLGVGDRLVYNPEPGSEKYNVAVIAAHKRFPLAEIGMPEALQAQMTDSHAACNVLDPLMTALMILNTRGVRSETVTPSEKLNKARIKNGKYPIPPYKVVDSTGYVTAYQARQEKRPASGGTHASPAPHIRMGHWRNFVTGNRSWIRDTLVNVPPELRDKFLSTRTHYKTK